MLENDRGTTLYRAERPERSREPREVDIRLPDDPRDERASGRIRHEYNILRALNDPRVPRPLGFFASHSAIALQHVEGPLLSEAMALVAEGRLVIEPETALDITVDVAQCLRHAHSVVGARGGIIHSHLSSSRIRLSPEGAVLVHGYGITPAGTQAGYTPPEQAAGAFLDGRSDQWTLGAICIEMLLSERLYHNSVDRRGDALGGRVGPWLARAERKWPELARVLRKMLAPAAGDRYEKGAELVQDLLEVGRSSGRIADRHALALSILRLRESGPRAEEDERPTEADPPVRLRPLPTPPPEPPRPADPPRLRSAPVEVVPDPERPQGRVQVEVERLPEVAPALPERSAAARLASAIGRPLVEEDNRRPDDEDPDEDEQVPEDEDEQEDEDELPDPPSSGDEDAATEPPDARIPPPPRPAPRPSPALATAEEEEDEGPPPLRPVAPRPVGAQDLPGAVVERPLPPVLKPSLRPEPAVARALGRVEATEHTEPTSPELYPPTPIDRAFAWVQDRVPAARSLLRTELVAAACLALLAVVGVTWVLVRLL